MHDPECTAGDKSVSMRHAKRVFHYLAKTAPGALMVDPAAFEKGRKNTRTARKWADSGVQLCQFSPNTAAVSRNAMVKRIQAADGSLVLVSEYSRRPLAVEIEVRPYGRRG